MKHQKWKNTIICLLLIIDLIIGVQTNHINPTELNNLLIQAITVILAFYHPQQTKNQDLVLNKGRPTYVNGLFDSLDLQIR